MEKPLNYGDIFQNEFLFRTLKSTERFEDLFTYPSQPGQTAKPLGKGAFGEVWKVKDNNNEKVFACKKMFLKATNKAIFDRKMSEYKLEVYYSYIMSFYGIGPFIDTTQTIAFYKNEVGSKKVPFKGTFYLLIELMDGTLTDYLKELSNQLEKKLVVKNDLHQALNSIRKQIKRLIQNMIASSLICHDFKSDNILYKKTLSGIQLKLSDFGQKFCCEKNVALPTPLTIPCRLNNYKSESQDVFYFVQMMLLACFETVLLKTGNPGFFLFKKSLTQFYQQISNDTVFNEKFLAFLNETQNYVNSIAWTSIHYMNKWIKKDGRRQLEDLSKTYLKVLKDNLELYIFLSRFDRPGDRFIKIKTKYSFGDMSEKTLISNTVDSTSSEKSSFRQKSIVEKRHDEQNQYVIKFLSENGLLYDPSKSVGKKYQTLYDYVKSSQLDVNKLLEAVLELVKILLNKKLLLQTLGPNQIVLLNGTSGKVIKLGFDKTNVDIDTSFQIVPNNLIYGSYHLFQPLIYYLSNIKKGHIVKLINRARLLMFFGIFFQLVKSFPLRMKPLNFRLKNIYQKLWLPKKDMTTSLNLFPKILGPMLLGSYFDESTSLETQVQALINSF